MVIVGVAVVVVVSSGYDKVMGCSSDVDGTASSYCGDRLNRLNQLSWI